MKRLLPLIAATVFLSMACPIRALSAAEPILISVPTALTALEGRESLKSVQMAVDEINAQGGVTIGEAHRLLKVETIDLRDASAGVPVSEALLGLEKIITEKKVRALLVGPFRSEALLAGMEILSKYRVPMLGTIAMSPKSEEKIRQDPEKYKYTFRVCLNSEQLVAYLAKALGFMHQEFGFKKLFVMHQDVLWARMTGEFTAKAAAGKMVWDAVGLKCTRPVPRIFPRAS
jgi:branched-chain amino acid transport system substrate-binding protein